MDLHIFTYMYIVPIYHMRYVMSLASHWCQCTFVCVVFSCGLCYLYVVWCTVVCKLESSPAYTFMVQCTYIVLSHLKGYLMTCSFHDFLLQYFDPVGWATERTCIRPVKSTTIHRSLLFRTALMWNYSRKISKSVTTGPKFYDLLNIVRDTSLQIN